MKYIDADRLKEEFQKRFDICKRVSEDGRNALDTQDWYRGKYTAYSECLSFIDSLQHEQPKEICPKCIHHGKDDDYCYNPHGGMQSLINENGVYECTGFCEKEEQQEIDIEQELYKHFGQVKDFTLGMQIGKYFYELGKNSK